MPIDGRSSLLIETKIRYKENGNGTKGKGSSYDFSGLFRTSRNESLKVLKSDHVRIKS